jgi:endonuclease/exonuclease/phosphatase family metal-dependent hydrolase
MKKLLTLVACWMLVFYLNAQDLNVMTFNIRYNNTADGENSWPKRKDKAISQILYHDVQLLGVQEALIDQMKDLQEGLKKFKGLGVGRNGGTKDEYSAIFYDTTRFKLLKSETFWLSEHPDQVASVGWDAALSRIVTWAQFKDLKTKKKFYFFNTHFDHVGKKARAESAKMILQKIKEIAGNSQVILTGDFNSYSSDEPYKLLVDTSNVDRLTDTKDVSATPHYGPTGTFNGFTPKEMANEPIDYIFIKNGGKVLKHATLSQTWGGRFSSDHFPVLATIRFK